MGFCGRLAVGCAVPWTLLVVCTGPDLVVVCAGLKREEEPRCYVRRMELIVSPSITIIVNLQPPSSIKQLRTTLGYTGYYRKFIKGYAQITTPMEKLLKHDVKFIWTEECQ